MGRSKARKNKSQRAEAEKQKNSVVVDQKMTEKFQEYEAEMNRCTNCQVTASELQQKIQEGVGNTQLSALFIYIYIYIVYVCLSMSNLFRSRTFFNTNQYIFPVKKIITDPDSLILPMCWLNRCISKITYLRWVFNQC